MAPGVARRGSERDLGQGDDRGCAAVVAAEHDRPASGKRPLERDEWRGIGAREAVDRLGGIADHRQLARAAEPRAQQSHLQRCGVLEFVDEQMAEAPPLAGRELLVVRDGIGTSAQHVVEVDQVPLALLGLVTRVELRDLAGPAGGAAAGRLGRGLVVVGCDEARLGPLDLGGDIGDGDRGRRSPAAHERREQTRLAFEHAWGLAVAFGRVAAELPERDRVEGTGTDPTVDAEATDPGHQLTGRLPGEGDREHVSRVDVTLSGAVGDATREHPGLAGPGRRDDGQRRRGGRDRIVLEWIEIVEERVAHARTVHSRCAARRARAGAPGARGRDAARPRVVFAALAAPISSGPHFRRRHHRAALAGARLPKCRPCASPRTSPRRTLPRSSAHVPARTYVRSVPASGFGVRRIGDPGRRTLRPRRERVKEIF